MNLIDLAPSPSPLSGVYVLMTISLKNCTATAVATYKLVRPFVAALLASMFLGLAPPALLSLPPFSLSSLSCSLGFDREELEMREVVGAVFIILGISLVIKYDHPVEKKDKVLPVDGRSETV